jgi:hypothetical protein
MKHFQHFPKRSLLFTKPIAIAQKDGGNFSGPEFPVTKSTEEKRHFHKRDTRISASGSGLFRSLWRKNCYLSELDKRKKDLG